MLTFYLQTILQDLHEMIQKMQAIVLERAAVVARDVTQQEMEMVRQLADFVNLRILEIPKCQSFASDHLA